MEHKQHPHIQQRKKVGVITSKDQHPQGNWYQRANAWLAVKITSGVGTMTCAWIFAIIAVTGIPAALAPGGIGIVNWFVEEFCQFVLLSIIIVGQQIQQKASDKRAEQTYKDAEAILELTDQVHKLIELNTDLTMQIHRFLNKKSTTSKKK